MLSNNTKYKKDNTFHSSATCCCSSSRTAKMLTTPRSRVRKPIHQTQWWKMYICTILQQSLDKDICWMAKNSVNVLMYTHDTPWPGWKLRSCFTWYDTWTWQSLRIVPGVQTQHPLGADRGPLLETLKSRRSPRPSQMKWNKAHRWKAPCGARLFYWHGPHLPQ